MYAYACCMWRVEAQFTFAPPTHIQQTKQEKRDRKSKNIATWLWNVGEGWNVNCDNRDDDEYTLLRKEEEGEGERIIASVTVDVILVVFLLAPFASFVTSGIRSASSLLCCVCEVKIAEFHSSSSKGTSINSSGESWRGRMRRSLSKCLCKLHETHRQTVKCEWVSEYVCLCICVTSKRVSTCIAGRWRRVIRLFVVSRWRVEQTIASASCIHWCVKLFIAFRSSHSGGGGEVMQWSCCTLSVHRVQYNTIQYNEIECNSRAYSFTERRVCMQG